MKLFVVPESSERCTAVMLASGRVAPALVAAIFGSFHLVILPAKMPATVSASSLRSFTPSTLKMTAIGDT